jgi:hypothetical protein
MPDAPITAEVERDETVALTPEDVRALESFQKDERDIKAALIHARRFAKAEPFADREEAGEAADAIKVLSKARKAADEHRLASTETWRANTAVVNAQYKELDSTAGAAEGALKRKGVSFAKAEREAEEQKRREEQERLDREAEQKAADSAEAARLAEAEPDNPEAQELAAETFDEAAKAATVTAPVTAAPKNLRGGYGSLGSYVKWKCEVTDAAAIPAEHMIPNLKSLQAAVDAESKLAKAQDREFKLEIPGLRIYPEDVAVSR